MGKDIWVTPTAEIDNELDERVEKVMVLVKGILYRHTHDVDINKQILITREVGERLIRHSERLKEEPF